MARKSLGGPALRNGPRLARKQAVGKYPDTKPLPVQLLAHFFVPLYDVTNTNQMSRICGNAPKDGR